MTNTGVYTQKGNLNYLNDLRTKLCRGIAQICEKFLSFSSIGRVTPVSGRVPPIPIKKSYWRQTLATILPKFSFNIFR